jgi:phosphoenolpyruvate synthase/pyruvate phosphate dikinase
MEILWLNDVAAQDVALVGGKVAHLSKLAAEYRVPAGFCLTTHAFSRWVDATLQDNAPMPPDLHNLIQNAYHTLARQTATELPRIAVRSSAVDEDGATASFAGQYETYLNISGVHSAGEAVLRCWRTARSERVQSYRHQLGLSPNGVKLAVLLQQMVPADISAFVFSANPVNGDTSHLIINANWGLGASIADGTVTPDAFTVRKSDMTLVHQRIADKERMTIMASDNGHESRASSNSPGYGSRASNDGTKEVNVPRFLRNQPSLTHDQILELCRLALSLETKMGWPVDVEAAWHKGQLYLLQCRPITAISHQASTLNQ